MKIPKERKEKIMKRISEAGDSENYETSWNEKGLPVSKKKANIKRGGKARAQGARFELKVREEMESRSWVLTKWMNNVDLEKGRIVPVKRRFVPIKKFNNPSITGVATIGTGFPDFIAFQRFGKNCEVIGIECKMNGILSKEEKEKCRWLIENKIFEEILIVKKGEKRGSLEYVDFVERYHNKT